MRSEESRASPGLGLFLGAGGPQTASRKQVLLVQRMGEEICIKPPPPHTHKVKYGCDERKAGPPLAPSSSGWHSEAPPSQSVRGHQNHSPHPCLCLHFWVHSPFLGHREEKFWEGSCVDQTE